MMKHNLPGPFTFILKASALVPKLIHSKKKTVGIRVPDNNIVKAIIQELGAPLLSSSLKDNDNIIEYATDPELIHEQYQDKLEIVVDGGYGDIIPSTVVDLTGEEFEIIREGKGDLR